MILIDLIQEQDTLVKTPKILFKVTNHHFFAEILGLPLVLITKNVILQLFTNVKTLIFEFGYLNNIIKKNKPKSGDGANKKRKKIMFTMNNWDFLLNLFNLYSGP